MTDDNSHQEKSLDQEKWDAEKSFRERELALKEREQVSRDGELEIKRKELKSSGWRSPLVVAIIAATLAGVGNAVVTLVNGSLQRQLENQKSEQTRILEMIKTGDPDKAANNLEFLLKAGLISDSELQTKLQAFLATRAPGSGPTLPSDATRPTRGGIVGLDDAVDITKLDAGSNLKEPAAAVGRIKGLMNGSQTFVCSSFLIAPDLVLTARHCIQNADSANLLMSDGNTEPAVYKLNLPPLEVGSDLKVLNYALLRVEGKPGDKHGTLRLSSQAPLENQSLSLVMFRGSNQKLAVTGTPDCRVLKVETDVFHHGCDTGSGSSGAPILNAEGTEVVGLHFSRDLEGNGVAVRVDRLLSRSKILRSGQ